MCTWERENCDLQERAGLLRSSFVKEHPSETTGCQSGGGEIAVLSKTAMTEVVIIAKKTAKSSVYMCRWDI